jgi:hypothetical protein
LTCWQSSRLGLLPLIGLWVELGQWEEAVKQSAYNRWPLASLQEESCEPRARDEHAWLRAFAGKGELP